MRQRLSSQAHSTFRSRRGDLPSQTHSRGWWPEANRRASPDKLKQEDVTALPPGSGEDSVTPPPAFCQYILCLLLWEEQTCWTMPASGPWESCGHCTQRCRTTWGSVRRHIQSCTFGRGGGYVTYYPTRAKDCMQRLSACIAVRCILPYLHCHMCFVLVHVMSPLMSCHWLSP